MHEYITVDELATRTTYAKETITRGHIARLLIEGIHFVRPFGGKKKLYIWENIEKEMLGGRRPPIFSSTRLQSPRLV
jgi:hypothetical protein